MNLPEFLIADKYGHIHVKDRRIGLHDLVFFYNQVHTADGLLEVFPTLTLALIHEFIAYYSEQRSEVDVYVAECEAEMARQRVANPPKGPSVAELRRRMAAKQATGA